TDGQKKEGSLFNKGDDSDDDDGDHSGKGAHKAKRRGLRSYVTRNRAIAGGGIGLTVGGSMWIFSIVQGPLQLIHLSQLLQSFQFTSTQEFEGGRNLRFLWHLHRGTPH